MGNRDGRVFCGGDFRGIVALIHARSLVGRRARHGVLAVALQTHADSRVAACGARRILRRTRFLAGRARSILEYRAGWSMIKAHPVFGVGPEGVQYEFDRYKPDAYIPLAWYGHLHSDYLQTAASRGLPALAFLLWFFALAIRDQHRLASGPTSNAASNAWLARGATAATIAYYVEGAFEYNFGGSQVVMLWLFLLVLGYAARTESPEC